MKIAIYAEELNRGGKRGVKTYTEEIIKGLLAADGANDYALYASGDLSRALPLGRARMVTAPAGFFWAFRMFPRLIQRERPDVVFLPIQIYPFLPFGKNKPKVVVTVHDVAFLHFPKQFNAVRRELLELHTRLAVKWADYLIVPSEATKADIVRFFHKMPEKIVVIPHGYSEYLLGMGVSRDEEVKTLTHSCPYLLFVGTIQPRKNLSGLVEAFERCKQQPELAGLKLVIAGARGWKSRSTLARIKQSPFAQDIILTGEVEDELLAALYRRALIFVLPALYEGFGLPLLEAMSFGVPVIAADNSSLTEVVGEAGLLVDAGSAADLADKIKSLAVSQSWRAELSGRGLERARELTWDRAAKATLEVLEKAKVA